MSIVDYAKNSTPLINLTFFPGANAGLYWSSTSNVAAPGNAHIVHFGTGETGATANGSKSTANDNFFRCVRTAS